MAYNHTIINNIDKYETGAGDSSIVIIMMKLTTILTLVPDEWVY